MVHVFFILSLLVFWYNVVRYNRYRNLVTDTKLQLVDLKVEISHKSIFEKTDKEDVELLKLEIENVLTALPTLNLYVLAYLYAKHEDLVIRIQEEEAAKDTRSEFFTMYKSKLEVIIFNHLKKVHYIEQRIYQILKGIGQLVKTIKLSGRLFSIYMLYPFSKIDNQREALVGVKAYRMIQTR